MFIVSRLVRPARPQVAEPARPTPSRAARHRARELQPSRVEPPLQAARRDRPSADRPLVGLREVPPLTPLDGFLAQHWWEIGGERVQALENHRKYRALLIRRSRVRVPAGPPR